MAQPGMACHCEAQPGLARQARQGVALLGNPRLALVRLDTARQAGQSRTRQGLAGRDLVQRSQTRQGTA